MTNELLQKAKECKSAEELLALAKENGMEMTENQAAELFARLNQEGELSDDELDSAAGGGCGGSSDDKDCLKDGDVVRTLDGFCCDCGCNVFKVRIFWGTWLFCKSCDKDYITDYYYVDGVKIERA